MTTSETNSKYSIEGTDLLELFKHYEEAGNRVKENMITLVTWLLAINTAMLGYAATELKVLSEITDKRVALTLGIIGMLISAYAVVLIISFGETMRLNWKNANQISKQLNPPEGVTLVPKPQEGERMPTICRSMLAIVAIYALLFVVVLVLVLATQCYRL